MMYRIIFLVCMALLTACNSYKDYVANETQLKTCRIKCYETNVRCNKTCRNTCENCEILSSIQAAQRFKKYKDQQLLQGEIVGLELQSFKDPLQCRKITCSCKEDLRVCIQSCHKKIHKNLKVVAAC